MKSMFDACCTVQQPMNAQQGGQQPTQAPGMQATTASTATYGTTSNVPPRHGQGVSNLLTRVEEKVPMVAPFTSSIRSAIPNATPAVGTQVGKLDSNVIGGQGEETRSFGEVIRKQQLPIVAIFPANSKTGLSTLRALTGYPNRNTCAKIQCIVRDEAAISMVRGELNEHLTDSVSFSFADYNDPHMMATAFMGVDRLMIIPPSTQNRAELVCNGIQAAKLAGVPHVVLMSAIPAQHPGTMFGKQFRRMEECLEGMRGYMNFTIMRMAWFMDNFLDMAADIVSNNRFLSSWGPSSVSAVSLADIGRSAAAVLSAPKDVTMHYNRMYHLTGPESLSGFRMAEIFSKVLGRQIAYQDLPREEMRKVYAEGMRLEAWQADGFVEMNDLFKSGAAAAYSTDVAMLTQGNHTTLERFVRNKRWYFAGQRSPLICIMPASGRVGTNTLAALMRDKSHGRIRAVVRGAEHKAELESKFPNQTRLEIVNGDLEDISSLKTVLEGVDSLLIIPPEKLERFSLIDEAIRGAHNAGVGHTILFSVAKAFDATALGRKFNAWERVLEQNSYSYTIVQSTLFQDLMFHFAEQVKQPEHRIHHWLGNGRFCPVDARDVGEACAAILREGPIEHHGHIYELTGPQALNVAEMTQILSKVLGYQIEAVPDITSEQVRATLQGKLPSFNVEEVIQAHETVANGSDTEVKPDLIKLTGRAKTIQAFFEDFRSRFEGRPSAGYGGGYDQQKTTVVETKTVVPSTTTETTPSTQQQQQPVEYQRQEEPSTTTTEVPKSIEPVQQPQQQNVEATKMAEANPSNVSVQVNVAQT